MLRFSVFATLLFVMSFINAYAVDKKDIPEYKQTRAERYLTSTSARVRTSRNKILCSST